MTKEELEKEAEEYLVKQLKKAKIKDSELLENQAKIQKSEDLNFITFNSSAVIHAYLASAEPRDRRIAELEAENERIKTKYYELQDILKKVRLALIKERTANIMNYGKGGVEMFNDCFEILKGVSND